MPFDSRRVPCYTEDGMEIEFIKMQLAGRDTVMVDGRRNRDLDAARVLGVVRPLLDRRRGIGADSLLLVHGSPEHEITVRSLTPRGTEEEPTLNELMCAARYAIDSGLASGTRAVIRSPCRSAELEALDSRSILAEIGAPLQDDTQELVESPDTAYTRSTRVEGRDFTFTPMRVGPYQAVAFVPSFDIDIRRLSREFRRALPLPSPEEDGMRDPAQLTYARVISRRRLLARTWRFGHGEARSEGYAAAAAAVAATLHGFTDRDTIVAARGGELYVCWSDSNNRLYVTGTPEYVFTGSYSTADTTRDSSNDSTNERHDGG